MVDQLTGKSCFETEPYYLNRGKRESPIRHVCHARLQWGNGMWGVMTDDIDYHRQRASRELNQGLASSSIPAARAHLRLSSLHFQRLRELEGGPETTVSERPPFIL